MSEVQSLLGLPAGYHRDLQLSKAAAIRAIESSLLALGLVPALVSGLEFDAARMRAAISPDMYATDVALDRVRREGLPFREAYRQPITSAELASRTPEPSLAARVSPGACGNLLLDTLRARWRALG
jgi:argininosuccinate lyase